MTRQAPWFHSSVPGDVVGCIKVSEALDYSTLLVSTADDIQLLLACPHVRNRKKDIQVSVTYRYTVPEKRKKRIFSLFLFFLKT